MAKAGKECGTSELPEWGLRRGGTGRRTHIYTNTHRTAANAKQSSDCGHTTRAAALKSSPSTPTQPIRSPRRVVSTAPLSLLHAQQHLSSDSGSTTPGQLHYSFKINQSINTSWKGGGEERLKRQKQDQKLRGSNLSADTRKHKEKQNPTLTLQKMAKSGETSLSHAWVAGFTV